MPTRSLAVVDIDGVVADVRHRLHLIEQRPKDWDAFFRLAAQDPPLPEGLARVRELGADHDVVWLTGRPERTRTLTEQWLRAQDLPDRPLHMRPDSDRRSARFYKQRELPRLAATAPVAVVVDDDPAVVEVLRGDGWTVELARWLPHSSTLRNAQGHEGRT